MLVHHVLQRGRWQKTRWTRARVPGYGVTRKYFELLLLPSFRITITQLFISSRNDINSMDRWCLIAFTDKYFPCHCCPFSFLLATCFVPISIGLISTRAAPDLRKIVFTAFRDTVTGHQSSCHEQFNRCLWEVRHPLEGNQLRKSSCVLGRPWRGRIDLENLMAICMELEPSQTLATSLNF